MPRPKRACRRPARSVIAAGIVAFCALGALAFPSQGASTVAAATISAASTTTAAAARRAPAHLSSAGAELMLEIWDAGGLRSNRVAQDLAARRGAIGGPLESAEPEATAPFSAESTESGPPFLATDVTVNNPLPLTCGVNGRPLAQAETSIAAWGPYVVASYNDNLWRCGGGTGNLGHQGHGYSSNYGLSFTDGGLIPGPIPTDAFHGDPTVSVNKKTGAFYISGLLRQGTNIDGVIALKAHFVGSAFVVDVRREIALAQGTDFLDKPWMTADSLTGNVYITWTNFLADGSSQIEMQRCDGDLNALGPRQVVRAMTDPLYSVQGSYPTVGPAGELYVPWTVYNLPFSGTLPSLEVVRSNDHGVTFGPVQVMHTLEGNQWSGGPGSKRSFGSFDPAMAVDMSQGPHRGRAYVVWDECVHMQNAAFGSHQAANDNLFNDNFLNATSFVPGGKIRGSLGGAEIDFFKFTGSHGQTFVMRGDSVTSDGFSIRVLCSSTNDATGLANWHTLVYASGGIGSAICGLPYDGTYYVRLGPDAPQTASTGPYVFSTALYTPGPADRARDARDQFISYSDDGISWSTPTMLVDSPAGFDGCFPTVTVDGLGRVHASWLDWRGDPGCGDLSDVYMTSSGDGGVTWSPNRRVSDVSSYWGFLASSSDANHGDYTEMASDGDHVYACFPDSRLGSPDVWVDGSIFRSSANCPASQEVPAGMDAPFTFGLTNGGNSDESLSWRLVDDRGWLTGATPALSGTQTLPANGGTLQVSATVRAPSDCGNDSTTVRFITSDPAIPGREDTCTAVARCVSGSTPTLVSLVSAEASPDRVSLAWFRAGGGPNQVTIERRSANEAWAAIGRGEFDGTGRLRFEDRGVEPGARYDYRLSWIGSGALQTGAETWVDVPVAYALWFASPRPNPSSGPTSLRYVLTRAGAVRLELFAASGARVRTLESGMRGPGVHDLTWDGRDDRARSAPPGAYFAQLTAEGKTVRRMLMVLR